MTAEVRLFASVDRSALQYLGLLDEETSIREESLDENQIGDPRQGQTTGQENRLHSPAESRWLTSSKVLVSMSPSNCLLAVAHEGEASFMRVYSDHIEKSRNILQYKPCFCDQLGKNENGKITCLLVIDLLYQEKTRAPPQMKRSSSRRSAQSWPCVAIGYESGHITFYAEDGVALLNQKLHEGAVVSIKCRTTNGFLGSSAIDENEQLLILYQSVLVTIDGFGLLQTLRVCRNQLQKGMVTESLFEYLKEACTVGGYNTTVRGVPSAAHKYISVGAAPMIGVYTASQDSGQPLFSEVAVAMASKLKSAVMSKLSFASGWLGWASMGSQTDTAAEQKVEAATPIASTSHLSDPRRVITAIVLSPNSKVALTTDELGRVLLLDCETLLITRIWKGYREAQCGFVTSSEDLSLTSDSQQQRRRRPRIALFVIIYAPRRGILEIWPAGSGSRIAAFNVGFGCRLLYTSCSCSAQQGNLSVSESVLLKSDGSLEDIHIPFYNTLSEQDRSSFADRHVLSRIKQLLQLKQTDKSLIVKLIGQLQTGKYLKKVACLLPQSSAFSVSDFLDCFDVIRKCLLTMSAENLSHTTVDESLSKELQHLLDYCDVQVTLLELYQGICDSRTKDCPTHVSDLTDGSWQKLQDMFHLMENEASFLWSILEDFSLRHTLQLLAGEKIVEKSQKLQAGEFLGCFLLDESNEVAGTENVCFHPKSELHSAVMGTFLIMPCLSGQYSHTDLCMQLKSAHVKCHDIMDLVFACLLSAPILDHSNFDMLQQLCSSVREISTMYLPPVSDGDHPVVPSDWWTTWIMKLEKSSHPYHALLLSLACFHVAKTLSTENKKLQEAQPDSGDWESVCLEVELWDALVRRLEDLLCLVTVVHSSDKVKRDLSVATLMTRKRDIFTQLVADYVVVEKLAVLAISWNEIQTGARCRDSKNEDNDFDNVNDDEEDEDDRPDVPSGQDEPVPLDESSLILVRDLRTLRSRFPNTLQHGILHVYCAYTAASYWKKDTEVIDYLRLSLSHLKVSRLLKSGTASVLWGDFFKEKVQALSLLTEKVGRAPKDRLCRKNVELRSDVIPWFLECAVDLLEEMQKSVDIDDHSGKPDFEGEHLWHSDRLPDDEGNNLLWRKVCCEPKPNLVLIRHHHLLCLVLHAITSLSLKSVKPLSFFDPKVRQLLFSDLSSDVEELTVDSPLAHHLADIQSFLCQIVTSSVSQFSDVGDVHVSWPDRAIQLCELFDCDVDPVRRLYVKELYKRGLDSHAEEFQLPVKNRCLLGSELLPVLGWRLSIAMSVDENKQKGMAIIPHLPPGVFEWLKSCKENVQDVSASSPLLDWASIKKLANVVMSLIPDGQPEHGIAARLADALDSSQ